MIYGIATLAVIVILVLLSTKLKSLFFKAKDAKLVKEDQALKQEQIKLEDQIDDLKTPVKARELSPSEIEEFWRKND